MDLRITLDIKERGSLAGLKPTRAPADKKKMWKSNGEGSGQEHVDWGGPSIAQKLQEGEGGCSKGMDQEGGPRG